MRGCEGVWGCGGVTVQARSRAVTTSIGNQSYSGAASTVEDSEGAMQGHSAADLVVRGRGKLTVCTPAQGKGKSGKFHRIEVQICRRLIRRCQQQGGMHATCMLTHKVLLTTQHEWSLAATLMSRQVLVKLWLAVEVAGLAPHRLAVCEVQPQHAGGVTPMRRQDLHRIRDDVQERAVREHRFCGGPAVVQDRPGCRRAGAHVHEMAAGKEELQHSPPALGRWRQSG